MKRVVKQMTEETVHIDQLSTDKYYGIQVRDEKGFIATSGYYSGQYQLRASDHLTIANQWADEQHFNNITQACKWWLDKQDNGQVYEFDTPKELFQWLAE